jgi:hypothetical protein
MLIQFTPATLEIGVVMADTVAADAKIREVENL